MCYKYVGSTPHEGIKSRAGRLPWWEPIVRREDDVCHCETARRSKASDGCTSRMRYKSTRLASLPGNTQSSMHARAQQSPVRANRTSSMQAIRLTEIRPAITKNFLALSLTCFFFFRLGEKKKYLKMLLRDQPQKWSPNRWMPEYHVGGPCPPTPVRVDEVKTVGRVRRIERGWWYRS
jgi:hypothetical protein